MKYRFLCIIQGKIIPLHYCGAPRLNIGNISTPEIRTSRRHIHAVLDDIWQNRWIPRGELYARISKVLGYEYHTANIKTIEEAQTIHRLLLDIRKPFLNAITQKNTSET